MLRLPTLFLIALLSPATWGDTLLPERFSAKFTLSNNGTRLGETHWTLNPIDGQKYLFESTSRTTGIWSLLSSGERVERSIWTRHDGNLRPLSYQYRRTDKESKNVDIVFNWEQGTSLATRKGHTRQLKLEHGTLDKLTYLLALMEDLARGQRKLTYSVADGRGLKTYRLDVFGQETLNTPVGTLDTLKILRQTPEGKRRTTLWTAPSLNYLPVKIEHRENDGSTVTMIIKTIFNDSTP